MKFKSKCKDKPKTRYLVFLSRYSLFLKLKELEEKYQPKDIYRFIGCSKEYYFGLKQWRWDCKQEYLDRLWQLSLKELESD